MPCNHCEEFSRSRLLRQAVATAGNGLPKIEQGMPAARRHRAQPPLVPLALGCGDALRLRCLEARPRPAPGGDRAGGGLHRPRPRVDLPRGWLRLAVGARADWRSELRHPASDPCARPGRGNPVRRGRPPRLEPGRGGIRRASSGGEDVRGAGDRLLEPRSVALHLASLLGGRRPAAPRGHRLDRAPARPHRHARTTRFKACRSTAPSRRRWPVTASQSRRSTGRRTTSGRATSGASRRS